MNTSEIIGNKDYYNNLCEVIGNTEVTGFEEADKLAEKHRGKAMVIPNVSSALTLWSEIGKCLIGKMSLLTGKLDFPEIWHERTRKVTQCAVTDRQFILSCHDKWDFKLVTKKGLNASKAQHSSPYEYYCYPPMSTSNEIAPSGQGVLSLLQEVDWLQPLVSPAVLRMERQEIDDTGTRERSRKIIESDVAVSNMGTIYVAEHMIACFQWKGERNCHDPPNNIQIRGSSTNAISKLNPYRRRAIDWGVGSSPDSSSSSLEISPGYYCGVGLETVWRTVLHNAKTAAPMAKLMIYKRMVYGDDRAFRKLMRKHLTPPRLGIVIQDHRLNEVGIP
ncbi:hypothetical protein BU17DRAFT_61785 [Hysterangium stoloniferum]|nr:hypothetical protein BU17DRAFT_61785 [Hysterangium stoloniferum]